ADRTRPAHWQRSWILMAHELLLAFRAGPRWRLHPVRSDIADARYPRRPRLACGSIHHKYPAGIAEVHPGGDAQRGTAQKHYRTPDNRSTREQREMRRL